MKNYLVLLLFISALCFAQTEQQPLRYIPAFPLEPNDLELSRLAQPNQYFDKIGRKAGLMGLESGQFEMWVWPWKPLRNFELQFYLSTSTQPILAKDIVRTISVKPEITTLTYTYESFTVKEHIIVPRNEPGAIILLEVHTTQPLSIIPGFIPVLQPMWPAGIGGQYSYWNDDVKGYIISEGQKRASFICGSPAGRQMASPPAHMFADNPMQFRIDVQPEETDGKFIPVIIAGANPDTVTWKMNFDSVKATYTRLWQHAEQYYRENYSYFRHLRSSTVRITTPDREINLAYEWGKIALDNLMVENPRLGYGMVAGFGLSGGGARPGFAWYFGGDAFINVLSMNSAGMFEQARASLAFTQKWQRRDNFPIRKTNPDDPPKDVGKMAHELSQSEGLCDWWNDYRYGYNHADTSPWYLVAMGDYVRTSGDMEFLRQSWKSVKQAYEWCLSKDSDGDGLMDLKGAGLGALEFGKLVGIYADVYTCGVFVQGVKEVQYMATLMGDAEVVAQASAQFKKAQAQLEQKFWLEKEGFYAYGATEQGEQVKEKTPWSGVAMMFGLLNEERTTKSIESFNSADICTDWGVRTLSNKSPLFEPTNYNYGAVWPFIGTFFNTAQFKHHFALPGYQLLKANIKHAFDHGLGVVPEVFSGELNEKLGEGYHHQGFSTTGYMLPLLRGLLGISVDELNKTIVFEPHILSEWNNAFIENVGNGKRAVNFRFERNDTSVVVETEGIGESTYRMDWKPVMMGKRNKIRTATGAPFHSNAVETNASDIHVVQSLSTAGTAKASVYFSSIPFVNIPEQTAVPGEKNTSLRIVSVKNEEELQTIIAEGISGRTYRLHVSNPEKIATVENALLDNNNLLITFDKKDKQEFIRKQIIIRYE